MTIVAFMPGDPKAVFREQMEEYKQMIKRVEKFDIAHKKFAEDECNLYYQDWTRLNANVKFCHSACHPDGYGERRQCNVRLCTWHMREAHIFEGPIHCYHCGGAKERKCTCPTN